MSDTSWRKCSNCKSPIGVNATYYVCSVSTCNRQRTGLVFCNVDCWDAHLPIARHKEAWAEERCSPSSHAEQEERPTKRVTMASSKPAPRSSTATDLDPPPPDEILVVASKVKAYIRARSGMNTSSGVLDVLSDRIRLLCDDAIRTARRNERKTVMDRDF